MWSQTWLKGRLCPHQVSVPGQNLCSLSEDKEQEGRDLFVRAGGSWVTSRIRNSILSPCELVWVLMGPPIHKVESRLQWGAGKGRVQVRQWGRGIYIYI